MKPLGFAFVVLLTLQSLQESFQIPHSWERHDTNSSEDSFSGDNEAPDNTSTPFVPTPSLLMTSVTSPSMTSVTRLDLTDTLQPEANVTGPQPGSLPSNATEDTPLTTVTSEDTPLTTVTSEDTRNSTGDTGNMTTTPMPPVPKTTNASFEGTDNGTSPEMKTESWTTNMTTNKLPDTVSTVESTTVQSTKLNRSEGLFDVRGGSEKGVSSNIRLNTHSRAWAAIVGIGVVVAVTALVVYAITKWKNHRDFSHRKLVEDTRGDPVLRLDNGEPLDLKFGGFAYYNPSLQGDSIQMTNFPQGHFN